jgi:serine/threonine protein kinase, bacterial
MEIYWRVVKLAAGSATHSVLPFTGLNQLARVAVDSAGNLYVTEPPHNRVSFRTDAHG